MDSSILLYAIAAIALMQFPRLILYWIGTIIGTLIKLGARALFKSNGG